MSSFYFFKSSKGAIMENQQARQASVRRTQWVRFYGLGQHNPGRDRVVDTRDTDTLVIPEQAHSLQFFNVYSAVVPSEMGADVLLTSEKVDLSPIIYCGGTLYSLEDGERLFGDHESVRGEIDEDTTLFDLLRQGAFPGTTHVIRSRDGFIKPFREGMDVILRR
ncbi:MAG: hypothetical protein QG606_78 [Patescibacteria group bacterium]|nr:hypothetical protein [Patescibacteria group bacterium]